jgi:hypothetical protein
MEYLAVVSRERQLKSGTFGGESKPSAIIDLDDRFPATSSPG